MKWIKAWLEKTHKHLQRDADSTVLVIGDERVGKSTFILGSMWLYEQVRGNEPDPESILNNVMYDDRAALRRTILNSNQYDAIAAMDAAHIFHHKEAMHGDQIQVEKNLLDISRFNLIQFYAYQDWADVSDQLQRRRAHFAFVIPRRGAVWGYSRDSIDQKYNTGDWPQPDLRDTFPDLSGTDLWEQFEQQDDERKRDRLREEEEPSTKEIRWNIQAKVALKAVKPWTEEDGVTQRDAANLIEYSTAWVNNRVQEWKDGEHRDLFDDDELQRIEYGGSKQGIA